RSLTSSACLGGTWPSPTAWRWSSRTARRAGRRTDEKPKGGRVSPEDPAARSRPPHGGGHSRCTERSMTNKPDLEYCRSWARALAESGSYDGADAAMLLPRIALGVAMGVDPVTACNTIVVKGGKVIIFANLVGTRIIRQGTVRWDITSISEE